MDRTERFYRINQLLSARQAVPMQVFLEELEVSPATFKRDLEYLRDRLQAPILWDRERQGYRYDDHTSHPFELPGMWFNESEVHALLVMEYLLENLQPGLLTPHIKPLQIQVRALLDRGDHSVEEIHHRIRILPMAARRMRLKTFEILCVALLSRKRLHITQFSRQRNEHTQRDVSPQRLVYYRDNWYLDSWCHLRKDLRTFSVDTIEEAELLTTAAKDVPDQELDEIFLPGYGIFSGKKTKTAKLRFTPERARWVSREEWHPEQITSLDREGGYRLEFPYSDDRELIMDILKFGPDVEVLGPTSLRKAVVERLHSSLKQYG
jgi:predicted DNA-binding transcriptional regulator YafY